MIKVYLLLAIYFAIAAYAHQSSFPVIDELACIYLAANYKKEIVVPSK